MRSTARACFRRPKISRFCAHTCPEGGDASKPGPTRDATELLGSRVKERAVQKYRRRAARTDRARSRVGREMEHSPPCCWDPQLPTSRFCFYLG